MIDSESARRELARRSLLEFTLYTKLDFEPAPHHKLICEALEAVERGELKRLMIFAPPRHTKSELSSRRFPAWYMGRNPKNQIICAAYGDSLAADFGYDVRSIVRTEEYRQLFPAIELVADRKAAQRWFTEAGGIYVAVGIGGGITGRGANLLLIDDPVKGREAADSITVREKAKAWWRSDAYSRLQPNAAIVIIQTRWHDDDLSGWLLEQMAKETGDHWEVIELPAYARDDDPIGRARGEALWPAWFPREDLEKIERVQGPREWSALYQQRPQPDSGNYFDREWIKWYDERPEHLRIYGASDYAVTSQEGDFTVHLVAGVDPADNLYLLDLWRDQTASDVWIETFIDLVQRWEPLAWAEEKGQIIRSLEPYILKRLRERRIHANRVQYSSTTDKQVRAQSIRARMSMGRIYLPRNAAWIGDFVHELLRFPSGVYDDQVDAYSLLGRMLAGMVKGKEPPQPRKPRFQRSLNEMLAEHDRAMGDEAPRI